MKSSGSIIIVVVVSYRKSRTFSVDIYYYSAQSVEVLLILSVHLQSRVWIPSGRKLAYNS